MIDQTPSVHWMLCFFDEPTFKWSWYSYFVAERSGCFRTKTLNAALAQLSKGLPW